MCTSFAVQTVFEAKINPYIKVGDSGHHGMAWPKEKDNGRAMIIDSSLRQTIFLPNAYTETVLRNDPRKGLNPLLGRFTKDNSNLTAPPVLIFMAGSGGLVTSDAANEALKQVTLTQPGLVLPERYSSTTRSARSCSTIGLTLNSFGCYSIMVLSKKFTRICGERQSRNGDYPDLLQT